MKTKENPINDMQFKVPRKLILFILICKKHTAEHRL